MVDDEKLERLLSRVHRSAKYRQVNADTIRQIGRHELAIRGSVKQAVKTTKRKLHQVGAVYMTGNQAHDEWLDSLRHARATGDADELKAVCVEIMAAHQSSQERLPILDQFYQRILGELDPIESVLDVACGLNPLAIPWMPLASGARYAALDIYNDLMAFLDQALPLLGVEGKARSVNVLERVPSQPAQVTLLLKAIPCLEQIDRDAGARLLQELPSRYVVASFPVQSLSGRRDRGMPTNYEDHFWELVEGRNWTIRRYLFESELAFLIDKGAYPMTRQQPGEKHDRV